MFSFDHIVRTASAAVCSLILTAVAIGGTIGPVSPAAIGPTTLASASFETSNG